MSITPNMNLTLPTVSVTLGPLWATELNAALTLVDSHDHSTGNGSKVTPAGLNINADLPLGTTNNLTLARSVRLVSQSAALSNPTDLNTVSSVLGDLYWNNSAGTAVQITSGGAVVAASDGVSRAFAVVVVSGNTTIGASDTYSFLEVNTGSSVQVTLPSAAGVAAGRLYEVKDVTGSAGTNNITVIRAGSDTINGSASSIVFNYAFGGGRFVSDGASNWQFSMLPGTATIVTNQIANAAVTQVKRVALGQQEASNTGSFSDNSGAFVDVTSLSVSITTTGRPVMVVVSPSVGATDAKFTITSGTTSGTGLIRVLRGATDLGASALAIQAATGGGAVANYTPLGFTWIDVPAAGTYTYKVQIKLLNGSGVTIVSSKLSVFEL